MIRRRIQRQEAAQQPLQILRREQPFLHNHLHHRRSEVAAGIPRPLLHRVAISDHRAAPGAEAAAALLGYPPAVAAASAAAETVAVVVQLSRDVVGPQLDAGGSARFSPTSTASASAATAICFRGGIIPVEGGGGGEGAASRLVDALHLVAGSESLAGGGGEAEGVAGVGGEAEEGVGVDVVAGGEAAGVGGGGVVERGFVWRFG